MNFEVILMSFYLGPANDLDNSKGNVDLFVFIVFN